MKCCGSRTTSTVRNATAVARNESRDVAAQLNALLFAAALKPLGRALGFFGDAAIAEVSQAMARSERGGLTDRLDAAFEAESRGASMVAR